MRPIALISFKGQRLLIIAPHPDDEVIGCGGLIARAKREGGKVYVLYLTVGDTEDFSKIGYSTKSQRTEEIKKVAQYLHYDGYRIAFPGNEYHLKLDAIPLKDVIHEIERGDRVSLEAIRPTILITPSSFDYNQDHRAAYEAAIAATRPHPPALKAFQPVVLTYELPYSPWAVADTSPSPQVFITLQEEDVEKKLEALKLYSSQLKTADGTLSLKAVETLAAMRGIQTGVACAEAFWAKRVQV